MGGGGCRRGRASMCSAGLGRQADYGALRGEAAATMADEAAAADAAAEGASDARAERERGAITGKTLMLVLLAGVAGAVALAASAAGAARRMHLPVVPLSNVKLPSSSALAEDIKEMPIGPWFAVDPVADAARREGERAGMRSTREKKEGRGHSLPIHS